MLAITLATLPIFALIFLGAVLRRLGMLGEAFWRSAERLVYFVLFPPLLAGFTVAGAAATHVEQDRMLGQEQVGV